MKIGDKVSFLNEVGGGIVSGFQSGNIVLVEDEDGFEIPMRMSEVVVVQNESYDKKPKYYNQPKKEDKAAKPVAKSVKAALSEADENEADLAAELIEPADLPITFMAEPEERKGGDKLYAYLAFVPLNGTDFGNQRFAVFYINDSNYYQQFAISIRENAGCHLHKTGLVEPNTSILLEELSLTDLNDRERLLVQMISFKQGKSFMRRPVVDVELRIDGRKFYKVTSFVENDFFDENAMLLPIVEDDRIAEPEMQLGNGVGQKIKEAMMGTVSSKDDDGKAIEAVRTKTVGNEEIIIVDLHAHEIIDSTTGMKPVEILNYQKDYFNKIMKKYQNKQGQKIVFIHGKGKGVLRAAIINDLTYRYKRCKYQDASFQEYGFGATQVTIR